RGQALLDPAVIRDAPVLEGHVEIGAHEHSLAAHVEIGDEDLVHETLPRLKAALPWWWSPTGIRASSASEPTFALSDGIETDFRPRVNLAGAGLVRPPLLRAGRPSRG